MPTQSTTYNSRVTDEALEKRFRDTFRSQGGAELVDDLYAQGVIVPVVDFTAAATGQQLSTNLQTAWDISTGSATVENTTSTIISNAGFWQLDLISQFSSASGSVTYAITDGFSSTTILQFGQPSTSNAFLEETRTIFLNSGESLTATSSAANVIARLFYRQIATVSGDLVNPTGFTSS